MVDSVAYNILRMGYTDITFVKKAVVEDRDSAIESMGLYIYPLPYSSMVSAAD